MGKVRSAFAIVLLIALVVVLALIRSEEENHTKFHAETDAVVLEQGKILHEILSMLQAERQKASDYYEQVLPRLDESNELQRQRNGKM